MSNVTVGYAPARLNGLRFSVGAQGSGKYWADDANSVNVPSYTILNAPASLDDPIRLGGAFGSGPRSVLVGVALGWR